MRGMELVGLEDVGGSSAAGAGAGKTSRGEGGCEEKRVSRWVWSAGVVFRRGGGSSGRFVGDGGRVLMCVCVWGGG